MKKQKKKKWLRSLCLLDRALLIVEEQTTNLMSLAILLHFLCAQHVSDIRSEIK